MASLKRYTKTLAGRLTGICWDVAISVLSLVVVPGLLLYSSFSLLLLGPILLIPACVLVFGAVFFFVFGVFWTFRGHL